MVKVIDYVEGVKLCKYPIKFKEDEEDHPGRKFEHIQIPYNPYKDKYGNRKLYGEFSDTFRLLNEIHTVHMENISHETVKLYIEDGYLYADIEILATSSGFMLTKIIHENDNADRTITYFDYIKTHESKFRPRILKISEDKVYLITIDFY